MILKNPTGNLKAISKIVFSRQTPLYKTNERINLQKQHRDIYIYSNNNWSIFWEENMQIMELS